MSAIKRMISLLCAAAILLACASTAPLSAFASEVPADGEPALTVRIEMSKPKYRFFEEAEATVRVQNNGSETLKNIAVSSFSDKHLLPAGSQSAWMIEQLEPGKSEDYSFRMVLNRREAGTLFERALLFFLQFRKQYKPMPQAPILHDVISATTVTTNAEFRHGTVKAVLTVEAWYETESTVTPSDPVDPTPRPQTTYLDRYVADILKSGRYTAQMEKDRSSGSRRFSFTLYQNGKDYAYAFSVANILVDDRFQSLSVLGRIGDVRFVVKDAGTSEQQAYLVLLGGYVRLEDAPELLEEFDNIDLYQMMQIDSLVYQGVTTGAGYVCESYTVPETNLRYDFYFASEGSYTGLIRWETTDTEEKSVESMLIRINAGADAKAFKISGREYTMEDLETLFS